MAKIVTHRFLHSRGLELGGKHDSSWRKNIIQADHSLNSGDNAVKLILRGKKLRPLLFPDFGEI